ncbi:MAG TPA: DUF6252 family protein [Gemmatimonadales bacterium]|nr:DUF6252 family protein [Gemmatimonadales bacterium]
MRHSGLVMLAAVCAGGCGGDTGPGATATVTAVIDGTAWTATQAVQVSVAGTSLIVGGTSSAQIQLLITIPNITTTGTYALGVGLAGTGVVNVGTQSWTTNVVGGEGSVIVTAFDATRVAGTFAFDAAPHLGTGSTGIKSVTSGTFDLTY